jgi:hypothetical protein
MSGPNHPPAFQPLPMLEPKIRPIPPLGGSHPYPLPHPPIPGFSRPAVLIPKPPGRQLRVTHSFHYPTLSPLIPLDELPPPPESSSPERDDMFMAPTESTEDTEPTETDRFRFLASPRGYGNSEARPVRRGRRLSHGNS